MEVSSQAIADNLVLMEFRYISGNVEDLTQAIHLASLALESLYPQSRDRARTLRMQQADERRVAFLIGLLVRLSGQLSKLNDQKQEEANNVQVWRAIRRRALQNEQPGGVAKSPKC